MTATALHRELARLEFLEDDDFEVLDGLLEQRRGLEAGETIVREGEPLERISVVLDGWAFRYKDFADGRRQVLSFLLPGDVIGLFAPVLRKARCDVECLTAMELAAFPSDQLVGIFGQCPRLALALSWLAGQHERVLQEQIARVGRRGATERMAHLFLELYLRLLRAGVEETAARRLPLTQAMLAETLGMSHVHANRCFRQLVRAGAADVHDGHVWLLDPAYLAKRGGFDGAYLEQTSVPRSTRQAVAAKRGVDDDCT